MTDASKENLIGYLCHALDDDEAQKVADDLRNDEQLRSDCQLLKCGLDLLAADDEPHEPPAHLTTRTCGSIWSLVDTPPSPTQAHHADLAREQLVHPEYSDCEESQDYPVANSNTAKPVVDLSRQV